MSHCSHLTKVCNGRCSACASHPTIGCLTCAVSTVPCSSWAPGASCNPSLLILVVFYIAPPSSWGPVLWIAVGRVKHGPTQSQARVTVRFRVGPPRIKCLTPPEACRSNTFLAALSRNRLVFSTLKNDVFQCVKNDVFLCAVAVCFSVSPSGHRLLRGPPTSAKPVGRSIWNRLCYAVTSPCRLC